MAALIAGCQPQTNIQTGLPSLSGTPQDKTAGDDVEWQEAVIEPVPDVAAELCRHHPDHNRVCNSGMTR